MKMTMLGTGHAGVTNCFNTCFLLEERGELFLVDGGGGNGLLRQLEAAGHRAGDIGTVFVTHRHLDHITGIFWLLRQYAHPPRPGEEARELTVYSHDEVISLLRTAARILFSPQEAETILRQVHLVPVADGESRTVLGRTVTFFDTHAAKAKQFGFSLALADGKRLTCCGDEPYNDSQRPYAEGSDWLLHEAFCLESEADRYHPHAIRHSTVKDAALLAEGLGVRNLVLYHTEDRRLPDRKRLYTEEAGLYFHGNVFVPEDLETLDIP